MPSREHARTPHRGTLASEGVVLHRAHAASAQDAAAAAAEGAGGRGRGQGHRKVVAEIEFVAALAAAQKARGRGPRLWL